MTQILLVLFFVTLLSLAIIKLVYPEILFMLLDTPIIKYMPMVKLVDVSPNRFLFYIIAQKQNGKTDKFYVVTTGMYMVDKVMENMDDYIFYSVRYVNL